MKNRAKRMLLFFALSALFICPIVTFAEEENNENAVGQTEENTTTIENTEENNEGSNEGNQGTENEGEVTPSPSPTPTPTPTPIPSDGYLKSLVVAGGKFTEEFKKDVYEYSVSSQVTSKTKNIKITVIPELKEDIEYISCDQQLQAYDENGERSFTVTLKDGENVIKINVKPENGIERTYTIKVTRATANLNLKGLTIEGATLNEPFDPEVYEYTADVGYNVISVTLKPTVEDTELTTPTIEGDTDLKVGKNTLKVVVKNQARETKEYKIVITRASEEEVNEEEEGIVSSIEGEVPPVNSTITSSDYINNGNNSNNGTTLTYVLVVIVCILLLAIGIIGIYFFVKTRESEKSRQKRIAKLKRKQAKIEEQLTGLMPAITEDIANEYSTSKEKTVSEKEQEASSIKTNEEMLKDTIELDFIEEFADIEPEEQLPERKSRIDRNVLEEFDDLFSDDE